MSNDRVLGSLIPNAGPLPEPVNAMLYVEREGEIARLFVCSSRAQVRTVLDDCAGTEAAKRAEIMLDLESSVVPPKSERPIITIDGWAAAHLFAVLYGNAQIREDDVDRFVEEVGSTYHLITPEEDEDGDQAILTAMDEGLVFRVWILPSREHARETLETVRALVPPDFHAEVLEWLEEQTRVPAKDALRSTILIEGFVACFIATVLFCLDEHRQEMS